MADPVKPFVDLGERIQEEFTITVSCEDRFSLVCAGCDMVKGTVVLNS
jgi:hypothetical protein